MTEDAIISNTLDKAFDIQLTKT